MDSLGHMKHTAEWNSWWSTSCAADETSPRFKTNPDNFLAPFQPYKLSQISTSSTSLGAQASSFTYIPDLKVARPMLCHSRASWQRTIRVPCAGLYLQQSTHQRRCLAVAVESWDNYFQEAETSGGSGHTQNSRPLNTGERNHGVFMGTVTSRSPQTTTIEELVGAIEPRPVGRPAEPVQTPSILTLLLTPKFAQYALDNQFPLRVMKRFGEEPATKPLDTITAVVDRLPSADGSSQGEEGMAYYFDSQPSPLSVDSQTPLQMSAQKPGSLTFRWSTQMGTTGGPRTTALQLPLAQTVFSNGLPSTLVHTRYDADPTTGALRQATSQRLESQTLNIPLQQQNVAHYRAPLVPLTPLRTIESSMGNIVRKLSPRIHFLKEDGTKPVVDPIDDLVPASEELEKAVSDYFKALDMAPESVQVWALIVPDVKKNSLNHGTIGGLTPLKINARVIKNIWKISKQAGTELWDGSWTMRNMGLLSKGCRLTRVLSGGGGWGKKAGLLSLDPDTKYSTRDLRGDQGWEFSFQDQYTDETIAKHQREALGEIVKPGEKIMFFLAPKEPKILANHDPRSFAESDRAFTFGAIPSSIDFVPDSLATMPLDSKNSTSQIEHHLNKFGALSEGGMAVEVQGSMMTKIDVPFGRVSVTTLTTDTTSPTALNQDDLNRGRTLDLVKALEANTFGPLPSDPFPRGPGKPTESGRDRGAARIDAMTKHAAGKNSKLSRKTIIRKVGVDSKGNQVDNQESAGKFGEKRIVEGAVIPPRHETSNDSNPNPEAYKPTNPQFVRVKLPRQEKSAPGNSGENSGKEASSR
jgi:hypothetical protein